MAVGMDLYRSSVITLLHSVNRLYLRENARRDIVLESYDLSALFDQWRSFEDRNVFSDAVFNAAVLT